MMDKCTRNTAERNGILPLMEKLEQEILNIDGVPEVDFDIDNYDELHSIIIIPKYSAKMEIFFEDRKRILQEILKVCNDNGLVRTGDRVEDMGEHLYIVTENE